jgi:hypothetical protein
VLFVENQNFFLHRARLFAMTEDRRAPAPKEKAMLRTLLASSIVVVFLLGSNGADGQDKKKRTGTLTGEIKSQKASPNGKNTIIEVLAPGEEKARAYRVQYDPKVKGPMPEVLKKVRAAKVGDRVQLEWIDTGEGLAITAFQVLKKAGKKDE